MKIRLIYSLLLILPAAFAGEIEYKGDYETTLEYYEAMSQKMVRETKYKEPSQAAADEQIQSRDFTPSTEIADEAFSKGDYKTALKHYEALGEEGDSRASMTAGLIHAEGADGIDADKAKAAAWFERSSDQGGAMGADLYEKMETKNELSKEDEIKAKNLIHEFRESDSTLTKGRQPLITDAYSSGTYSPISGIDSKQHAGQSELVQISDANIYAVSTDIEANFSPTRSSSGDYFYRPEKVFLSHSLPERIAEKSQD